MWRLSGFNIFRKVNIYFKYKGNRKLSLKTGNVSSRSSHLGLVVNDLYFPWGSECLSFMLPFGNSYSCLWPNPTKNMFSSSLTKVYINLKVTRICSENIQCQKCILYCIGPLSVIKNVISLFSFFLVALWPARQHQAVYCRPGLCLAREQCSRPLCMLCFQHQHWKQFWISFDFSWIYALFVVYCLSISI